MAQGPENRWLLLIHEIPPKPAYLRVKVGRRLQRIGAVAIKNTVYVLPTGDSTLEDFQWTVREIVAGGGQATVCEASFVEGRTDVDVEALFNEARSPDYEAVAEQARRFQAEIPEASARDPDTRQRAELELARLQKRLSDVQAIDFFGAPGGEATAGLVAGLARRLREPAVTGESVADSTPRAEFRGRTWVTRAGVHVDRMASAWLIRRFIDPEAHFKFVPTKGYQPEPGELRFDMFDAEFTHEDDRCTFEVLLDRMGLEEGALRAIAEIVHDIDLKDAKFSRQDALGFERLVAGIAMAHKQDEVRLERASAVLDDLYEYFRRKPEKRRES
jgi:hypothetical protein